MSHRLAISGFDLNGLVIWLGWLFMLLLRYVLDTMRLVGVKLLVLLVAVIRMDFVALKENMQRLAMKFAVHRELTT